MSSEIKIAEKSRAVKSVRDFCVADLSIAWFSAINCEHYHEGVAEDHVRKRSAKEDFVEVTDLDKIDLSHDVVTVVTAVIEVREDGVRVRADDHLAKINFNRVGDLDRVNAILLSGCRHEGGGRDVVGDYFVEVFVVRSLFEVYSLGARDRIVISTRLFKAVESEISNSNVKHEIIIKVRVRVLGNLDYELGGKVLDYSVVFKLNSPDYFS